jgi:capsular exopolysaccharide synthesis family protein
VGIALSSRQAPVYRARAVLDIEGYNENFLNLRDIDPAAVEGYYTSDSYLQTQAELLKSRSVIERAIDHLSPDRIPELASEANRPAAWRRLMRLEAPAPVSQRETTIQNAMNNINIRSSRQTRLVELLVDSRSGTGAAEFANALAEEFVEQNVERRLEGASSRIAGQVEKIRRKLEESEARFQEYSRASGLLPSNEKSDVSEDQLRLLQDELSRAQADRMGKQSRYENALRARPDSLPDVLDSPILRDGQARLIELRRQLAELSSYLTPAHHNVERIHAQIADLNSALNKEQAKVVTRIRNEYDAAKGREKLLDDAYKKQYKMVSDQATRRIRYSALKGEVESYRNLYALTLQRVNEAGLASAIRANNIRIVDRAVPVLRPFRPNRTLAGGFGMVAGFLFGAGLLCLRARPTRNYRRPGEASRDLNVPELGVVPQAGRVSTHVPLTGTRGLVETAKSLARGLDQRDGKTEVELVTWQQKQSFLADSFRWTLSSILFSKYNGGQPRTIVLTSPGPSAGKTTTVSNLGIALAETNRRCLLIDADIRRPRLHEIYKVQNLRGLSDLLAESRMVDSESVSDCIRPTDIPGLMIMPAGSQPSATAQLLHGYRLEEILRQLRREFEVIIVDTPPMLHMPDARAVGRLSDGVVLVLRAGRTSRVSAAIACQRLAEGGVSIIGTVLNGWDVSEGPGYESDYVDPYWYSA